MTTRIALADDSAAFREGFAMLMRSLPGMDLVGEAATGAEAVRLVARVQPDVVVMDLHMPDLDGIEATRRVTEVSPHIRVLVLTMSADDNSVLAAMRAGASGYLVKGAAQAEIVRAISAVAAGEVIFGPAVARQVLARITGDSATGAPFPDLTDRERQVLELVARGESNSAISRSLDIADKTVRNHLSSIFTKLQVQDRAQAIVRARESGLGVQRH